MSESNRFPLLLLPILALNEVLKSLSPFELIAISLCNKSLKSICKQCRMKLPIKPDNKCCGGGGGRASIFTLELAQKKEIRLQSNSDSIWVFHLIDAADKYSTGSSNYLNVSNWIPDEKVVMRNNYKRQEISTTEYTLQIPLSSSDSWISTISTWIQCIKDMFNSHILDFTFDLDFFTQEELLENINVFDQTIRIFLLKSNGKTSDEIIQTVINLQKTSGILKLDISPTPDFVLNFKDIQRNGWFLQVSNCHWLKRLDEVLEIGEYGSITLKNTTISGDQFQSIIEKWMNGWQPKWGSIKIELADEFDIQNYMNGRFIEIIRDNPVQVTSFVKTIIWLGPADVVGYNLLRSDRAIAMIKLMNNNTTANIVTYPFEENSELYWAFYRTEFEKIALEADNQ